MTIHHPYERIHGTNVVDANLIGHVVASYTARKAVMAGAAVALAVVMMGCGGSAFSALDRPAVEAGAEGGDDAAMADEPMADAGTGETSVPDAHPDHDAEPDARPEAGPTCVTDLSGVGTGDFGIHLHFATTQSGYVALANQRHCDKTYTGDYWDVRLSEGLLWAATNDGPIGDTATVYSSTTFIDGAPHQVDVERRAGILSITVDGADAGSTTDTNVLGAMPPLQVGDGSCIGVDYTVPFAVDAGTLDHVCLTKP